MYTIKKAPYKITEMNDKAWDIAEVAKIEKLNWADFSWKPNTTAKLLYSDFGLHIQMQTDEKPLLARHTERNSEVCTDSCMECFIKPNANDDRYMNFEFNAFGTMYLAIRYDRDNRMKPDVSKDIFEVKTLVEDGKWTLQWTIPFTYIEEIYGGHTDVMYGNLYKCGEETEIEHYVTYYPVKTENPDFHCPGCFGEFRLEK